MGNIVAERKFDPISGGNMRGETMIPRGRKVGEWKLARTMRR